MTVQMENFLLAIFSVPREILTNFNQLTQFLGLISSPFESHERPKTEFVSHEILISRLTDQKFYAALKKVYFMDSEIQLGVVIAQKREIQISHKT
jgi:hypothetical protein